MLGKLNIVLIVVIITNCKINSVKMESNQAQKMNYEMAFEYCIRYAESEKIDVNRKLKVKTDDRFRFDFNYIDMSYNSIDSILIVRACIARQDPPRRDDLIACLDSLTVKYREELAEGYLEFDETALEVDGYKPNRLNIRYDFISSDISISEFIVKVDNLLTAAIRWGNNYYMSTYDDLDRAKNNK